MKANFVKIAVIALVLAVSVYSCFDEEYKPDCKTGDCITLNIKGFLRVQPSGEGLRDVLVEVSHIIGGAVFLRGGKIGSGKTNKNGEFDFNVTIKPNDDSWIKVIIPSQNKYINISNEKVFLSKKITHELKDDLKKINFDFYKKTTLTINLIRTLSDDFDEFNLAYTFLNYRNSSLLIYENYSKTTTNKNIQIETAADVYTKIVWNKRLSGVEISKSIDSLICKQNVSNVIIINY